jgi:hypothetical protein
VPGNGPAATRVVRRPATAAGAGADGRGAAKTALLTLDLARGGGRGGTPGRGGAGPGGTLAVGDILARARARLAADGTLEAELLAPFAHFDPHGTGLVSLACARTCLLEKGVAFSEGLVATLAQRGGALADRAGTPAPAQRGRTPPHDLTVDYRALARLLVIGAGGCAGRDEMCPLSTEGGTRRVQLVREGGGKGGGGCAGVGGEGRDEGPAVGAPGSAARRPSSNALLAGGGHWGSDGCAGAGAPAPPVLRRGGGTPTSGRRAALVRTAVPVFAPGTAPPSTRRRRRAPRLGEAPASKYVPQVHRDARCVADLAAQLAAVAPGASALQLRRACEAADPARAGALPPAALARALAAVGLHFDAAAPQTARALARLCPASGAPHKAPPHPGGEAQPAPIDYLALIALLQELAGEGAAGAAPAPSGAEADAQALAERVRAALAGARARDAPAVLEAMRRETAALLRRESGALRRRLALFALPAPRAVPLAELPALVADFGVALSPAQAAALRAAVAGDAGPPGTLDSAALARAVLPRDCHIDLSLQQKHYDPARDKVRPKMLRPLAPVAHVRRLHGVP